MKANAITLAGETAGTVELDDAIFGLEPRADILHRMVRWQLAKRQAGTHSTLGKSDVSYSTRKIYKQKGTGGARHGDRDGHQRDAGRCAGGRCQARGIHHRAPVQLRRGAVPPASRMGRAARAVT